jgi:hypothetical protein
MLLEYQHAAPEALREVVRGGAAHGSRADHDGIKFVGHMAQS